MNLLIFFISSFTISKIFSSAELCFNHQALNQHGHYLLTKIIPCGYMKDVLPSPVNSNDPLKISFNVIIQDINSINAANMDFRVDMFLYMTWEDTRLNLTHIEAELLSNYIILPAYAIDYIWTPDPYITNAKETGISTLTNEFASLTLFTNNTLRYSVRFYSVIGCQMDFHQYPRDIQNCSVVFQSFKYSSDQVVFVWRDWLSVEINGDLRLLQFSLKEPLEQYEMEISGPSNRVFGKKSQALVVSLEFHREVGHHLVQTFVPSFLLVALSWFSFWMGLDAIPGRVTLLVTSMLTLTTIFIGIQDALPPVAYIKAIDVWMGGCTVFIFAALGEFVIVKRLKETHTLNRVNPSIKKNPNIPVPNTMRIWDPEVGVTESPSSSSVGSGPNENGDETHNKMYKEDHLPFESERFRKAKNFTARWFGLNNGRDKIIHEEIDKMSRMIFPLMFLLFMLIYFPIMLTRSF